MQDVLVIFAFFIILLSIVIALIKDLSSWVYITILLAIASWLLLFPQILSPYVVGIDAHFEHIIAEETLRTGHWDPDLSGNIVNAALSITILTPFISIVSGIPLDWVLKIILTIYPLISIPIIWKSNIHILSFSNRESFLSLLLLIGTSSFMLISVYGRQEVGLFSGLVLLYFLHFKKSSVQLSIVLIFLVIGLIFSHYSTAIILIITYAISSLFLYLFQRDKCSMRLVLFSIVFMVFWLILIVYASMASISHSFNFIYLSILDWATENSSIVVEQQLNPTFYNIFQSLNYVINIFIIIFLVIGTSYLVYSRVVKSKLESEENKKYFIFAFLSSIYILLSVLPGFSSVYNAERIYLTTLYLFSGFSLIGFKRVFVYIVTFFTKFSPIYLKKSNKYIFVVFSFFVLVHFVLQVGILPMLYYGDTNSKYFGDISEDRHYTLEEEVYAVNWLQGINNNNRIYTDFYGRGRLPLRSYGNIPTSQIVDLKEIGPTTLNLRNIIFYQQKKELNDEVSSKNFEQIEEINNFLQKYGSTLYNSGMTEVKVINLNS